MPDLASLFADSLASYKAHVEFSGSHSGPEYKELVGSACSVCQNSIEFVNKLELFSFNESCDELTSVQIKYLIFPALYGYFLSNIYEDRLNNLQASTAAYKDFIKLCTAYGISSSTHDERRIGTFHASNDRQLKIMRYKQRRALEEQVDSIIRYTDQDHADEEDKREFNLTLVRRWITLAEDELIAIERETTLLNTHPESRTSEPQKPPPTFKPFILTRNAVQSAVFGAGYPSLPTMTIEQFYEEQVEKGIFPASIKVNKDVNRTTPSSVRRIDPSDEEKVHAEKKAAETDALEDADDVGHLEKARKFDEFKDEHRRGDGNRMNRA